MDRITLNSIHTAIESAVTGLGCEIVDVEFVTKNGDGTLTVYIDKVPTGVTLDDCEAVSIAIDPILDELDPTGNAPYTLNVSSPGLDRPFKTQRDYERNYGKEVEVKLYAPLQGKKVIEGVLTERSENVILLNVNGSELSIENNRVAKVSPLIKFE